MQQSTILSPPPVSKVCSECLKLSLLGVPSLEWSWGKCTKDIWFSFTKVCLSSESNSTVHLNHSRIFHNIATMLTNLMIIAIKLQLEYNIWKVLLILWQSVPLHHQRCIIICCFQMCKGTKKLWDFSVMTMMNH